MQLTWLDSNSWLIEISDQKILLDPWLEGELTFGNTPWLFRGKKTKQKTIPNTIHGILLSQGLEDHTHPPTLKKLSRSTLVMGSPNAIKTVKNLGYEKTVTLNHGDKYILNNQVEIITVPGSMVGFNLVENGYILKNLSTGESLYYEPHGYHSPELKNYGSIDTIIAPVINLTLPLIGPVIKGQKTALEVCQWLNPKTILPTAGGGDIDFQGLLMTILKEQGTIEDLQQLLLENNLSTKVLQVIPGQPVTV